jgi:beta-lysine N6-acetyltransferase
MDGHSAYYTNEILQGSGFAMHYCLDRFNKRVRVDDYQGQPGILLKTASSIAKTHSLTKLFIKSREEDWQTFLSLGCMLEGVYKGYFDGKDAYCMAVYFDLERRRSEYWLEEDEILNRVLELPAKPHKVEATGAEMQLRTARLEDAETLAALYGSVFRTYPTPMNDPSYIRAAMGEETVFYVVESASGELASAASAEINRTYRNAEITDCATLAAYRNQGLMRLLVHALEEDLYKRNIGCYYSLSRALSFGMNAVFHQMGYRYCGRLTKNCDIYDKFEDMNLWVKYVAP